MTPSRLQWYKKRNASLRRRRIRDPIPDVVLECKDNNTKIKIPNNER